MEALQHLKAELAKASSPAVMVLASPAVDAACGKNGLSLAELLRPFGIIRQLNGTVGGGWAGLVCGIQQLKGTCIALQPP